MQPTEEPPAYTKSAQQIVQQPKPAINTDELQVNKYLLIPFHGRSLSDGTCLIFDQWSID